MTKPAPTLIGQISKKQRDIVQKVFEHEGANLSRDEFFHWTEAERTTNTRRAKQAAWSHNGLGIHLKNRFGCTDEEAEAMLVRSTYETGLVARGVARRIQTGNPEELEAALSLSARLDWVGTCYPGRPWGASYPDVWLALSGLAAGDIEVVQAILRARCHDRGHKATVLIYDGVEAIVMRDLPAQARFAPKIADCRVSGCYQAILETLHGMIEADSPSVGRGLERVLATFRRQELLHHETIISFHAHALAELAYWVSPKLLADFDVDRPLPWDREYFHWLRRTPRSTAYRDLSAYSSLLNRWVHDLQEPDWWQLQRASAKEGQPTSDPRGIPEEVRSEESEEVRLPADCAPACLLIRHAVPARRKHAGDAVHFLDIGRTRMSGYGPGSAAELAPWLKCSGWVAKQPWLLLARFKGESWIHCIASKPGLVSLETLGRSKHLQILSAGFDPGENRTHALFHNKGNIAAELTAAGKGKDPLGVHSFQSSVRVKTFLKQCKTVRQAVDGFFAAQGAVVRMLTVIEVNGLLELRDSLGRAVSAGELAEIGIRYFVPITAEEDPAGVRLQAAINTGDVEAARQAIASGASLEFIPDEFRSPLSIAFDDTHPGDWRGVAKLLIEAGAPIDGYDWEESLICSPIKNLGKYEEAVIKRMEAMLSLGASIDSRGRLPAEGFTPLHLAVEKNQLQVVQFLIDEGADLDARDVYGRTPLELAEDLASDDLEEESARGASDEASSSEGVSPPLTPLELFVSQYSRTPRESARRRIQIVKLLREVYAHR